MKFALINGGLRVEALDGLLRRFAPRNDEKIKNNNIIININFT